MMAPDVLGYVLAGGESSRMQRSGLPPDKALLMLEGKTLLERALATLAEVCPDPRVLCGTVERCARLRHLGPTVPDRVALAGPLGGLHAALCDAAGRGAAWLLVTPVDLPWMPSLALNALVQRALASGAATACMQAEGFTQPLPAVVSTDTSPLVDQALQLENRKLLPVLQEIALRSGNRSGLCIVDADNLEGEDSSRWFWNVNTPEDFAVAQQHETLRSAVHQSKHGG